MKIQVSLFGKTRVGESVLAFKLTNANGNYVRLLSLGGIIQSINVFGADVCLGYDTVEGYESNDGYFGALIGRHANRIAKGRFILNDKEYVLAVNNGENHLHGGIKGFNSYVWNHVIDENGLTFYRTSPDGEEGYPGRLDIAVTYSFSDDDALSLHYHAVTDADTVVNFTNHCYFNLSGKGDISEHVVQMDSEEFTEGGKGCLPTGKILSVEGTPFDFRTAKPIGRDINCGDEQLTSAGGYDHNMVLKGSHAATVCSPVTGIKMDVTTTLPGMQFYTGNFIKERIGKSGKKYDFRSGVCFETQYYPNGMECKNFPSPILRKGEAYDSETIYSFSKD